MSGRREKEFALEIFPATLGNRERLITYGVGYGVGMGVPVALGLGFALGFGQPIYLLLPLPFAAALLSLYFFRPTGFSVASNKITVVRPVGSTNIPLRNVRAVTNPATHAKGMTIGILRVEGIYGTFGSYWNRNWGRFRAYITDHSKQVELRLVDGSRVIISPDVPSAFVAAVRRAAARSGVPVTFDGA